MSDWKSAPYLPGDPFDSTETAENVEAARKSGFAYDVAAMNGERAAGPFVLRETAEQERDELNRAHQHTRFKVRTLMPAFIFQAARRRRQRDFERYKAGRFG